MEPAVHRFDREVLSPFYQQVADAIREVDTQTLLFLEASYFSNMGVRSGILPVQRNGGRDPQQIYAPHGYDLIVDTTANEFWSPARVDVIFSHHEEISHVRGWPMLVGEWGAFWVNAEGVGCGTKPQADQLRGIFERACCGDTFWCYPDEGKSRQNLDGFRYSDAIVRGIPLAVNGTLVSYSWKPEEKVLDLVWVEGDTVADTELWVPGPVLELRETVRENPDREPVHHLQVYKRGMQVSLPAGMSGEKRTLRILHG
jgi:endoglycosylceramidase